jgi:hypothetical protein
MVLHVRHMSGNSLVVAMQGYAQPSQSKVFLSCNVSISDYLGVTIIIAIMW